MTEFHIAGIDHVVEGKRDPNVDPTAQPGPSDAVAEYRTDSGPHPPLIVDDKSDVYVLYGARLDDVEKIMRERGVFSVPVVGFIEELGWFGPTIIGICHGSAALSAVIFKDTRPKNICVQSVMQRMNSGEEARNVDAQYSAVLEHYRKHHVLTNPVKRRT